MRKRSTALTCAIVSMMLGALLLTGFTGRSAADDVPISYTLEDGVVYILTENTSVAVSTLFPAAAVKNSDAPNESAYGFMFSSILGYNESEDGGLALEDMPYHASMEHATWTHETPTVQQDGDDATARYSMQSSVNMNKRVAYTDGNPEPGSPGIVIIEDWATVTVSFVISSSDFSSTFDGVIDDGLYPVNGSTELKFDITVDINVPIDADHLALDIGLMMMEFGTFEPTAMDEQYVFEGFQDDEVSISDPDVNETVDDELIMHTFQHRDQFKQLFAFLETDETGFFSWATQSLVETTESTEDLEDLSTYYRTDGDALKVYISSPVTPETVQIMHDPSIGVFPGDGGAYVELPDGSIIGSSAMSTMLGLIIGLAVAGGVGVALIMRRSSEDDQSDTVVLQKNRYYKGK